jgi:xylan 1,4-beta-xylosidase
MRGRVFLIPGLMVWLLFALGCGAGYKVPEISGTPVSPVIMVDASESAGILDHSWEVIAGSGHGGLYVREGWSDRTLAHLADVHENLGIQMVRFHGIFGDEVGIYQGPGRYDFSELDRAYEGILAAGVKPFIELSFMPEELASGRKRGFPFGYKPHISPPESYEEWGNMIGAFARHLLERYGLEQVKTWYFEVWNEPNLAVFWGGDMDDYFRLYDVTARAIKSVHPDLQVGGPASSQAAWIWELLAHCQDENVPLDFISTHGYYNENISKLVKQADKAGVQFEGEQGPGFFYDEVRLIKEIMDRSRIGRLPLYITEWNSSIAYSYKMPSIFVFWPNDHDLPNDAAFMCKAVKDVNGYTDGFSHWTYSDVFEEWGLPGQRWPVKKGAFHGGFGLITIDGIHKPSYHAFAFLHKMGKNLVKTRVETRIKEIDAMATLDSEALSVLVWYWLDTLFEKETSGPEAVVTLRIENLPLELTGKNIYAYRIDREHGNTFEEWLNMGKPGELTDEQVARLKHMSDETIRDPALDHNIENTSLILEFSLPPAGVVFLSTQGP